MLIVGIDILPSGERRWPPDNRGHDDRRRGRRGRSRARSQAMEAANVDTTVAGHNRQQSVWRLAAAAAQSIDDADHGSLLAHGSARCRGHEL
jgi:hypothetical protein